MDKTCKSHKELAPVSSFDHALTLAVETLTMVRRYNVPAADLISHVAQYRDGSCCTDSQFARYLMSAAYRTAYQGE